MDHGLYRNKPHGAKMCPFVVFAFNFHFLHYFLSTYIIKENSQPTDGQALLQRREDAKEGAVRK